MSFHAKIRAQLAHYAQGQHPGAIFGPLTLWHKHLSCLYHFPCLQEELIKAKLPGQRLTEHNEFDCVPVVLPAVLDLADVFSRVGEQEVTDQKWSVAFQIVSRQGKPPSFTLVGVIDPTCKVCDDLVKEETYSELINTALIKLVKLFVLRVQSSEGWVTVHACSRSLLNSDVTVNQAFLCLVIFVFRCPWYSASFCKATLKYCSILKNLLLFFYNYYFIISTLANLKN